MSTSYGTVTTKEGVEIDVDASQIGDRVALVIGGTYHRLESAKKVRELMLALDLGITHVWGNDEMYR